MATPPVAPRRRPTARRKRGARTKQETLSSQLYNLQLDVNDLRQQIHQLCLRRALLLHPRSLLPSPADPNGSSCKKVEKLFSLVNRGYRVHDDVPLAFMESLTGGHSLFQLWQQHTETFASRHCELHAIRVVMAKETDEGDGDDIDNQADPESTATTVVRVEATSHGAFTLTSLKVCFPRVLDDAALTQTLVGRAMAKPMVFHFEFNSAGRVVRYGVEPDFFVALAKALDDPIRAAMVLNGGASEGTITVPFASETQAAESFDADQSLEEELAREPTDPRHAVSYLLS
jgi:hypothetical protein